MSKVKFKTIESLLTYLKEESFNLDRIDYDINSKVLKIQPSTVFRYRNSSWIYEQYDRDHIVYEKEIGNEESVVQEFTKMTKNFSALEFYMIAHTHEVVKIKDLIRTLLNKKINYKLHSYVVSSSVELIFFRIEVHKNDIHKVDHLKFFNSKYTKYQDGE